MATGSSKNTPAAASSIASISCFLYALCRPAYAEAPKETSSSSSSSSEDEHRPRNDLPRTTAAGFDPEALERGARALREINSSNQPKKVCHSHFCTDMISKSKHLCIHMLVSI